MKLSSNGMTIPAVLGAVTAVLVTGVALLIEPALADNMGEIGEHLASQGEGAGKAISTGFYLGGMAAGGGAFLKLKANRDSPQQHPLSHSAALALVCAGLLYLPQTFKTAGDTVYDENATKNVVTGTTIIGN